MRDSINSQPPHEMASTKRRASNFVAHDADSASNKRRRQQEEFQFTAATIQTTLAAAGRPRVATLSRRRERALPRGSVNMELAKVMTSSEYDCQQTEMATAVQDRDDETRDNDDPNGDVSAMYMVASLIQSTRHYYSFASDDTPVSFNLLPVDKAKDQTNITQDYMNYNRNYSSQKTPSEDNSEGSSTWTPPSSYGDWNNKNRKTIDNDNRSDEQSSCGSGDRDESSSDNCLSSFNHDGCSSSFRCFRRPQVGKLRSGSIDGKPPEGAIFVVG